ncbi:MAG: hypothetical protein WC971_07585 [Coriobacteriia bacterium]
MTGFWSGWGWPLATALLGLVYTALVFRQWLARRKPHQLAWSVGLLIYAVAAAMEFWSEFSQHWDPTVYRLYLVLAASMVGFLGLGTLYLMAKNRRWGDVYLAINIVLIAVFLWGTFTHPVDVEMLKPGITVGGKAMGATMGFPRVMSFTFNIPGTLLLLGGAIVSAWRFSAKNEYKYRMWGNVLIAVGTLIIAGAGSMARAGSTVGLYPAEMVASAILLWGFLVAGTLEKGAKAVKQRVAKGQPSS